jgi:hypothetical protein
MHYGDQMAIIRAIIEPRGRVPIETGNLYVLENLFVRALNTGQFLWLTFIDPYGDTVLNHLQIDHFLEEWERLYELQPSEAEAAALRSVRDLAEYCLEASHRYLRFCGD